MLEPQQAEAVVNQLTNLAFIARRRGAPEEAVIDALTRGLKLGDWDDRQIVKWAAVERAFTDLLSMELIRSLIKTADLAFNYANFYDVARILVDIRPVSNDDRNEIHTGIISVMFRLQYISDDGDHSLSILMDKEDVEGLRAACDQAIAKIESVRAHLEKWGMAAVDAGGVTNGGG